MGDINCVRDNELENFNGCDFFGNACVHSLSLIFPIMKIFKPPNYIYKR